MGAGPRDRGSRHARLGIRDPPYPQSLKVGPKTSLKFKSGTPGSTSKFKSGTPSPFFNEFIFFRIFHRFLFLSFLNKIYTKKYQLLVNTSQVHLKTKKISDKKLNRTPVNSNPIKVIIFLHHHRLAFLSEVYL